MINPNHIILFQGDSITDAGRSRMNSGPLFGDDLGYGYPRLISNRLLTENSEYNLKFFNRGVSGNRIKDMAYRWEQDAIQLKPDMISILIGVNDTWNYLFSGLGASPGEYHSVFKELLESTTSRLPNVQLILCEPFLLLTGEVSEAWREDIGERQETVRVLAREYDGVFIPFQSALNDASQKVPARQLLDDGVHPTGLGHKILADCWLNNVMN